MTSAAHPPCPFDAPRPANNEHWNFIGALSVSSLYLSGNQTWTTTQAEMPVTTLPAKEQLMRVDEIRKVLATL